MSGKWFSYWGAGVNGACGDGVPVGKISLIILFFKFVSKFMFENYTQHHKKGFFTCLIIQKFQSKSTNDIS